MGSWNDYLNSLPQAQRECWEVREHCDHLDHLVCCVCGYETLVCADPNCDATAYLGERYCARHVSKP